MLPAVPCDAAAPSPGCQPALLPAEMAWDTIKGFQGESIPDTEKTPKLVIPVSCIIFREVLAGGYGHRSPFLSASLHTAPAAICGGAPA